MENLYPVGCLRCGVPLTGPFRICTPCHGELPWLGPRQCPRCARPDTEPGAPCGRCQQRPPAFGGVHAAVTYAEPVPDWVHRFKYGHQLGLAPTLAGLTGDSLGPRLAEEGADLLVPVPLHRARLRQRGFNQAQLLARELGRRFALPVASQGLDRVRDTRPQVGLADRQRGTNVRRAFAARPSVVAGRSILLVDDVVTTGATADAAAKALLEAGAEGVLVVAVARA